MVSFAVQGLNTRSMSSRIPGAFKSLLISGVRAGFDHADPGLADVDVQGCSCAAILADPDFVIASERLHTSPPGKILPAGFD